MAQFEDNISDGLANALKQRQDFIKNCEYCGSSHLTYHGLGVYVCYDCKKLNKTNYARAREYVESHENCTVMELMAGTGLTKGDVDALLATGSITYGSGGIGVNSL